MKLEHKSLLIGVIIGFGSVLLIFFVLGDIKTEFTYSIGKQDEKVIRGQEFNHDHIHYFNYYLINSIIQILYSLK